MTMSMSMQIYWSAKKILQSQSNNYAIDSDLLSVTLLSIVVKVSKPAENQKLTCTSIYCNIDRSVENFSYL
jgi:hypothetical protein